MDSLKTTQEFTIVYKHGFFCHNKGFTLYIYPPCKNPNSQHHASYPHLHRHKHIAHISSTSTHPLPSVSPSCTTSNALQRNTLRLGLSISRKIGNAITRNRLKRRIRMLCRESLQLHELQQTLWIVFVAKKGIADMSFLELQASWHKSLHIITHKYLRPKRYTSSQYVRHKRSISPSITTQRTHVSTSTHREGFKRPHQTYSLESITKKRA